MADSYCGEIRMFAGNYAPDGWLLCNGAQVNIADYQPLYSLIGTAYGGDAIKTFALPNLCGRVPLGNGPLLGGRTYTLGQFGGAETVALTAATIPAHTHTFSVNSAQASSLQPNPKLTLGTVDSSLHLYTDTSQGVSGTKNLSTLAISADGGSNQPHANMMPSVALTFIICCLGEYPSPA